MEALQRRFLYTPEDGEHSVPARVVPLELAADAQLFESGAVEKEDCRGSDRRQCLLEWLRGLKYVPAMLQIFTKQR